MAEFTLHDDNSAPEAARPRLEAARQQMGFVPNLFGMMAEAPATLEAYQTLSGIFDTTSLSAVEREVVLLATAVENRCHFCVAAHSGRAKKAGMAPGDLSALRSGERLPTPEHDALARFTRSVVRDRGWLDHDTMQAFLDAGFTRQQVLEVVLGVALKTLSNYTNHVTGTPLNRELEALAWDEAA